MTEIEDYTARAAESLAARDAATNERDRAHHNRAHSIWRRLIANVGEAAERAAMKPPAKPKPLKAPPSRPW